MSMSAIGVAWISVEDAEAENPYWAESAACHVHVQRTDENEVRVGIQLDPENIDDASVYLTVSEASRLAHMLGIAVLANEAAAHEAASL